MKSNRSVIKLLLLFLVIALSGCAALPDNSSRSTSQAYTETSDTPLGQKYASKEQSASGQSAYLLLPNGLDAFVARVLLTQAAERSIDTQYYLFHGDEVGLLFADQLWKAADRGVRVRLLLDDIDLGGRDLNIAAFESHPNIEVRVFNPFGRNVNRIWQYVTGFGKQTRRAHNKSFTVDNQATILGGRNIGNEYFDADPALQFKDLDVMVAGPIARDVSNSFDEYWNSSLSYPVSLLADMQLTAEEIAERRKEFDRRVSEYAESEYIDHLKNSDLANNFRKHSVTYEWSLGEVFADPPEKLEQKTGDTDYQMAVGLRKHLAAAEKDVLILSPYFVPGKSGVALARELRERGVRVRILTNSLSSTDVGIVHAGYARYRKDLLRAGVELFELNKITSKEERKAKQEGRIGQSKSSLHAKAFVIDGKEVFVGSLNLDPRSIVQNTEIGVLFESSVVALNLIDGFDRNVEDAAFRLELKTNDYGVEEIYWHGRIDGEQTTLDHDPYTSFWRRLGISLIGLLPIESQI